MSTITPPSASRSSSYHTSLDHIQPPLTHSLSSSSRTSSDLSSPTTPEPSYTTTQQTRKGTALVISRPTQVSFVPTSDIQTAVSITADRIVIDTILPPTAQLPSRYPLPCTTQPTSQIAGEKRGEKGIERDFGELLAQHKQELYKTLLEKLTDNYDPNGKIKEEIFATLTGVTKFPDPVGTNRSGKAGGKKGCPCICCEMGCAIPLQPVNDKRIASTATQLPTREILEEGEMQESTQKLHSFLEMTETSKSRKRFGFLSLPRRFSRSKSNAGLASTVSQPDLCTTALPVPAPAVPPAVTQQVVPPVTQPPVTNSRSFADLVRRRRDKHQSTSPAHTTPAWNGVGKGKSRQSLDEGSLRLPARSSSHSQLNHLNTSGFSSSSNLASTSRGGAGRFSLDSSTRPMLRADTPVVTPTPPPRKSSKLYAIVSRKPVPPLGGSGSATLPRSATGGYLIGQIVEEEEDEGMEGMSRSRRQSALMSSYVPGAEANLVPEGVESADAAGSGWGFRSLGANGGRYSLDQTRGYEDRRQSEVGVAI